MSKIFKFLCTLSIEQMVQIAEVKLGLRFRPFRILPMTKEFLLSNEYREMMMRYTPSTGAYGLHEASTYTRSYIYRHKECLWKLGVFRWRGMQEYLELILPLVADENKRVIDYGGAGCPLGFSSKVVDIQKKDAMGRKVQYHTLKDVETPVDTVFACHVLEHVRGLEKALVEIKELLYPGGHLIVFVPSYTNEGWQAGIHSNPFFGRHVWTFYLSDTRIPKGLSNGTAIDDLLRKYFQVKNACYCGDDSIFCLCSSTEK